MTTWVTSRTGVTTLAVLVAIVAGLAFLSAIVTQGPSVRTIGATLLGMSFMVFLVGGVLFAGRAFLNWQIGENSSHLIWERGLVSAAVLLTVLGLALLEDLLHAAGDTYLARLGMVVYLFGAVIVVNAETTFLNNGDWNPTQVVVYVVLAFLAQAAIGAALLQTGLVAGWVGWGTIIWNLGCLLIMLIVRPRDIYYPVLHHVAPLIIGIALVTQAG